jgi:predicted nucleic acid-binding protein
MSWIASRCWPASRERRGCHASDRCSRGPRRGVTRCTCHCNRGEALYITITERERGLVEARRTLGAVDQLPLEIVSISRATVLAAAHIKTRFPISYASAFAVVTAQNHGGIVMTGEREFEPLAAAGIVAVAWLPRRRP